MLCYLLLLTSGQGECGEMGRKKIRREKICKFWAQVVPESVIELVFLLSILLDRFGAKLDMADLHVLQLAIMRLIDNQCSERHSLLTDPNEILPRTLRSRLRH